MIELTEKERIIKKHKTDKVLNIFITDNFEDKTYSCWLKRPSREDINRFIMLGKTTSEQESIGVLFNELWLEGDEDIKTDGLLYVQAINRLGSLFEAYTSEIKKH